MDYLKQQIAFYHNVVADSLYQPKDMYQKRGVPWEGWSIREGKGRWCENVAWLL